VSHHAELGDEILAALRNYVTEVRASRFPEQRHTDSMPEVELKLFEAHSGQPA
jgi:ketopantoate hydroxymethyltransferase